MAAEESDILSQLDQLSVDAFLIDDKRELDRAWGQIKTLLLQTGCDPAVCVEIVGDQDIDRLTDMVEQIRSPRMPEIDEEPSGIATSLSQSDLPPLPPLGDEDEYATSSDEEIDWLSDMMLRQAMRAFRRRLKLKLDAATSREAERIFAIQPPTTYPEEVWVELVAQGKLLQEGKGFYRLPE